jgi:hypothetical protein
MILLQVRASQHLSPDTCALLSALSQYPDESEILFPPLSNIEVEGFPRVEALADGGEVLLINARININLRSLSREELEVCVYVCV